MNGLTDLLGSFVTDLITLIFQVLLSALFPDIDISGM
jgi:hypothetical protein